MKSKFWALTDDGDSDEVIAQSPYTLNLVRHVVVHGFTKDQLYEAELVLQDSSVKRWVEQPITPALMNSKVELVRNIMKALTDVHWPARTPWFGMLPR